MRPFVDVLREAADLHQKGELAKAEFLYEHLLGAQPDDGMTLYMYGTLKSQLHQFGTAIQFLDKASKLVPDQPGVWHNLGVSCRNEGHDEKARNAYRKGIELNPENPELLAMMSGAYVNCGQPKLAEKWARESLKYGDLPQAKNHLGLALLEQGKWEGWEYYEARWDLPEQAPHQREYECPKWDGTHTSKLAIHGEQGIGDEILFMSCFDDAKKFADEIVIECAGRLVTLFERSFGVKCYPSHDALLKAHPDVTAHIAMGSLPGFFRKRDSDFPRHTYLKADPERVKHYRERLLTLGRGPYVGIGWHGGTKGTHQNVRNAPLTMWHALVQGPATFLSLQYGDDGPAQAKQLGLPHWQEAIDDLDEFAALVGACDLVISVCQSAIHFAGALGTPCWVLTPSQPAWRYGVSGEMKWYGPHVRLFRQRDDWAPVFLRIGKELVNFARLPRTQQTVA